MKDTRFDLEEIIMHEKLVIVPKKNTGVHKILMVLFFVLTCFSLVLSMIAAPTLFLVPAIIFGVLWYVFAFRSETEFEYTYYDGELRFAKIKNKSRRKRIAELNMEDVIQIAPKGDRSTYKYENDKNLPFKSVASGNAGAKVYEIIGKGEKGNIRYEFEPDEEMLDAIMVKYPRVVIK